ncbi:MAG TPA: hypothetical protein VGC54_07705 [Planctomycetota bacterium]
MQARRFPVVLFLLLAAACGAAVEPESANGGTLGTAAAAAPATAPVLERVVVIGASLSAGFGLEAELGKRVGFDAVIEAMLVADHEPVANFAGPMVFLDPFGLLENQADKAELADPTLVMGLDFLFWYVYGYKHDETERVRDLETGLALLDRFACPILVATLPDMSEAVGKMLREEQMPAAASLAAANERILAYAAGRANVHVVPLPEFLGRLHAGKSVQVGGGEFQPAELDALLQWDRLHPSLEGAAAVAAYAFETLLAGASGIAASALRLEPRAAAERVRIGSGMRRSEDGTWYHPVGDALRKLVPAASGG